MSFNSLNLIGFRNHHNIEIDATSKYVFVTGPNGAGKTNILEAISLFAPGKGLRGAPFCDMIPQQHILKEAKWAVSATCTEDLTKFTTYYKNRKIIKVDANELTNQIQVCELMRILWLTPAHDNVLADSKSCKRKFFDRMTYNFFPSHWKSVCSYETCLRDRMKIIKEESFDALWVLQIEKHLALFAFEIITQRLKAIDILTPYIKKIKFVTPEIGIKGNIEDIYNLYKNPLAQKEEIISRFQSKFKDARAVDAKIKQSTFGVHRSNFEILHDSKNIGAVLCSTGEKKMMLISLILSQAKALSEQFHQKTTLLLDEVFAHLDENYRNILMSELDKCDLQTWITTTDRISETKYSNAKFFNF